MSIEEKNNHPETSQSSRQAEKPSFRKRRPGHHGPMGGPPGGMPGEKAKDFKGTLKKLCQYLKPYTIPIFLVLIFAVGSTVFSIVGPKILANATTSLFTSYMEMISGVEGAGIDFPYIQGILLTLLLIYSLSSVLSYLQNLIMSEVSLRGHLPVPPGHLHQNQPYAPAVFRYPDPRRNPFPYHQRRGHSVQQPEPVHYPADHLRRHHCWRTGDDVFH